MLLSCFSKGVFQSFKTGGSAIAYASNRRSDVEKAQAALLPLGLTFSDDGVLFNGVPIEQESTSGRLKIFTPMLISIG